VIFVDAPQEVRLRRAQLRGWTKAEFTTRESLQTPMAQKRQRASVIIDNSASLEETLLQVNRLWETITHSYR
jgi:dephospho-CoA kinase